MKESTDTNESTALLSPLESLGGTHTAPTNRYLKNLLCAHCGIQRISISYMVMCSLQKQWNMEASELLCSTRQGEWQDLSGSTGGRGGHLSLLHRSHVLSAVLRLLFVSL